MCQLKGMKDVLAEEGGAEKCSTKFQMKICLKSGICQVLQRSRQLMWCHSGVGWWLPAMPSLKSESGADSIVPTNMGDALESLLEDEDYQYIHEVTKGKGRSWRRRNGTARENPHQQFAAEPNFLLIFFSRHVGLTTCLGPVHLCFNPLSCCLRCVTTLFVLYFK